MKRLLLALLTALVFASPAFAIVGGPWDNSIPGNVVPVNPSNIEGTYQGTLKGKNIAGVMRFSSSDSGQVIVSTTIVTPTLYNTITGAIVSTTTVNTHTVTASGFADFFFEGKTGNATVSTSIDLGGRKVAGLIEGAGNRGVPTILTRPATATAWRLTDSIYFNGTFSAKFAPQWAKNRFSGKGTLTATKFDFEGWNADVVSNPSSADPENHIITAFVPVSISGVKTSDTPAPFLPPTLQFTSPTVVLISGTTVLSGTN